eukprot:TRINITY_DN4104_c0_g1_i20.p1 TRINITY_DN4104_c0_g1~~TRINITY_DN4104_c0_g1_i20.p1  ORF type:complete len:238 (+),score=83.39 TRINITY_DN4104_c0_g1_i20:64-714(+)
MCIRDRYMGIVYCWEGFKKMFLRTSKVKQVVEAVHVTQTEFDMNKSANFELLEEGNKLSTLFSTSDPRKNSVTEEQKENHSAPASFLAGNPVCMVCLNIGSYAGGGSDPWGTARGKIGVTDATGKKLSDFQDQDFGDGKIEFVTFDSVLGLAAERMLKGQGRRVAQGAGPFFIKFKAEENRHEVKTYFQCDGEYFMVLKPKLIKIRPAPTLSLIHI